MDKEPSKNSEAKIKSKKRTFYKMSKRMVKEMEQDLANSTLPSQEMQGYYEHPCEPYAEKVHLIYAEKRQTHNDESNAEDL